MQPKCLSIFLVLMLCLPEILLADKPELLPQDLALKVWTKQQGLPDDAVTAILQTRDGYLWIGTLGGLVRFDGMKFVPVTPVPFATKEALRVIALCEDTAGRLWQFVARYALRLDCFGKRQAPAVHHQGRAGQ